MELPSPRPKSEKNAARRLILLVQSVFLLSAIFQFDSPFLSTHNDRQNQTFDVARNAFHQGWRGLLTPKASFSLPGFEQQPYTVIQLEFPFHGLFGWPLAAATGHERAAVRLVSILFALISIQLIYEIICCFAKPVTAVVVATIWASAPLLIQFGQVPMPDILATTGMLAAFFFALRVNLPASSAAFLFSILAKLNVIVFGLPILTALLLAKGNRSVRKILFDACLWGAAPLLGIISWLFLVRHFSPPTPWTLLYFVPGGNQNMAIANPMLWLKVAGSLLPFGAGVLGSMGVSFAIMTPDARMNFWLKLAIVASNLFYLIFVLRIIYEPQYFLPVLAWLLIAAYGGLEYVIEKLASPVWRTSLAVAVGLHLLVALACAYDLKASRVPDFAAIQRAAQLLPQNARVVVVYRSYGASPAVWLDRNVIAIHDLATLTGRLPELKELGFTHLCIIDVESRHNQTLTPLASVTNEFRRLLGRPAVHPDQQANYASPTSSIRQYCDRKFAVLLDSPHTLLYRIM